MFSLLEFKLFFRLLKNEALYFINMLILLSSLFFILFVLFASKEIFTYYSDENSMLLPQHMMYVNQPLNIVKERLAKANISSEKVLLASSKNYEQLSIFSNINAEKSLPKKYTLLAFEMHQSPKLHLRCQGKELERVIQGVSLKHHKDWLFTTAPLEGCTQKSQLKLITAEGEFPLELKRNSTKAKLLYKSTKASDPGFYRYLIHLEESLFITYFPYSKFFANTDSTLTKEAQTHAKMLNSLFKLIFTGKKERIILNHLSYRFLTDYKKIPFRIHILNEDFQNTQTVLDETGIELSSKKLNLNKYLIIANRSSYPQIEYDATLIFSQDALSSKLFANAITINREDFLSVQKSASLTIKITSYLASFTLVLLLLALFHSFISRLYKHYRALFHTLLFYGFELKVLTLFLSLMVAVSIFIAYAIEGLLLQKVNTVFSTYYIDLISINLQVESLLFIALFGIIYAYKYESKVQKNLIINTKE